MFIDSHTHLNISPLNDHRSQHLQDFVDHWGVWLSLIWTNLEDSKQAFKQATSYQLPATSSQDTQKQSSKVGLKIGCCVWVHPEYAWKISVQEAIEWLENLLEADRQNREQGKSYIIWIWEIGTDLHREEYRSFHKEQKALFHAQCELALKYNLPIVIHSRDDFEGTIQTLLSFRATKLPWNQGDIEALRHWSIEALKIYFHCRGYWPKELKVLSQELVANSQELYIGFCWNISYPKAQVLRDSFQYCLDHDIKILLETDAPFLAPQAIRGQQNTPAHIHYTYEYISDYFYIPLEELQKIANNNFMQLYFKNK